MKDNYLDQLNPQQRAAVEYCSGPQLVIAGAGSGKTRVLTYKIVHLLHLGIPPYRIMALTFTNKAAREMRERIAKLVEPEVAAQLWMGTFHSIFARILRINAERIGYKHDYTIYDQSDSHSLVKMIVKDLGLDDKVYRPSSIQSVISNMKNAMVLPEQYCANANIVKADRDIGRPATGEIYTQYCRRCRIAGAMDFDDLLVNTSLLLKNHPDVLQRYQEMFQYILVDEYQDTNFAQHTIVLQLTQRHNRLCVVGDDAQSIYSFRGANVNNILQLDRFYPGMKTFKLERNYRSTKTITGAANSLIAHNKRQIQKHLYSENATGEPIEIVRCVSGFEEAYYVAARIASLRARQGSRYLDFVVLYRTNAQSRLFEEAFSNGGRRDKHGNMRNAIPYRIFGGLSFYQRKEIKDAVAYLRLIINPDDDEALRRVINYPARGIGDTTLARLQHCATQHQVSIWHVINNQEACSFTANRGIQAKIKTFADLISGLILLNQNADAHTITTEMISQTGLLSVLLSERTPENISRRENINELIAAVSTFVEQGRQEGNDVRLTDFLAQVALLTDQDVKNDKVSDYVTLMTVHSAKGLEFRNVIIVGLEENLFPSALSSDSMAALEEERRLFYVAITRAEQTCLITFAGSRFVNGSMKFSPPSRFLSEIDPSFIRGGQQQTQQPSQPDGDNDFSQTHISTGITTPPIDINDRPSDIVSPPISRPKPTRVPPASPSKPTPAAPGEFTRHTADELHIGDRIAHQQFGLATITAIDTSRPDHTIDADFDITGHKKLILKFAKFKIVK